MLVFGGGMNLVLGLVKPAFDLLGCLPSLKIPLISRHDEQVHDPNTWKVNEVGSSRSSSGITGVRGLKRDAGDLC